MFKLFRGLWKVLIQLDFSIIEVKFKVREGFLWNFYNNSKLSGVELIVFVFF